MLEQIGAHHAYAKGLTGRGVRIGIDDSIVDYTQTAEFGNRVKLTEADGASLAYNRPDGDRLFGDVGTCRLFDPTCSVWVGDSEGNPEAANSWIRQIVDTDGWPAQDDSVFVLDEHFNEFHPIERLFRWKEVPTPYGEGRHGTIVASVAAGRNLGVAPGATIIPVAQNLTEDQRADGLASSTLRHWIASLPATDRGVVDNLLASAARDNAAKFDIINRSYGRALFDPDAISSEIRSELRWFSSYLPEYLRVSFQIDTPDAEKTILVYAAGNDQKPWSGLGADYPYYIPALRGHSLSVVATDPTTGVIADYSNRCGPLPTDWDTARHGPHYCLAAPGTVRGLVPNPNTPGQGDVEDGVQGTSFAAPMVSGALALMMEHFRGTRGNTAVVKRMLDTADRSGQYGDLETYGAGFLDLEAALSPVGTLNAGQSARSLRRTILHAPVAFGPVAERVSTIELAAFDRQDFPFWIPLSSRIAAQEVGRSPIPVLDEGVGPAAGLEALGQHWTTVGRVQRSWLRSGQWVAGFGPSSASLARQPGGQGWGYGLSFNDDGYLGSRTAGAFGSDLRSGFSWVSRTFAQELDARWSVKATGMLAFGAPRYEDNAIFKASPSVLSAMSIRVGTETTGLTLEQPLRAETGTGTFRIENGRIENDRRLYDEHRIHLRPDSREVRMTLRHEHDVYGGRIAFEAGATINAGHVTGARETHMGLAFSTAW
ncbi:MAG: S8 family serine peptidase [Deltaproteobacteria bacterium]|nr:S8 family serine peptidase [Deltaproteobacteria bacterium]